MAEETQTLSDLSELGSASGMALEEAPLPEPKKDAQGRSYATGKRKNAVARVWVKPGTGKITVNGKDSTQYFARPVLRMVIGQPFTATRREDQFDVDCTEFLCTCNSGI